MVAVTVICNTGAYGTQHLDTGLLQQHARMRVVAMQNGPDLIVSCGTQSMALLDHTASQQSEHSDDDFIKRCAVSCLMAPKMQVVRFAHVTALCYGGMRNVDERGHSVTMFMKRLTRNDPRMMRRQTWLACGVCNPI